MKKLAILLTLILVFMAGCGQAPSAKDELKTGEMGWSTIVEQAKGSEVRIFMWGGDEGINRYMDEKVAPRLKEEYDITLVRTPMDIGDVLQKLSTEKKTQAKGTIDIIWLNGENFKNAKTQGLLAEPFVSKLPNFNDFVDGKGLDVNYDFGTPTEGLEAPWGKVQFVFQYNSEKVPNPPKNFTELAQWIKANPGKFTYPEAEDFTGNAFLRHLLYETIGVEKLLDQGYNQDLVEAQGQPMWDYLKDIKPYLWRKGETYPQTLAQLDQLYSQGEVWMTMGYNEARAESFIKSGAFPATTKSFIMESGSIGNTHFLAIPFNSPNQAGAMVAINYLLSPEAQLAKMDPAFWGENTVLAHGKLPGEMQRSFESIDRGASVLSAEELHSVLKPEVDSQYVNWIKENWLSEVVLSQGN